LQKACVNRNEQQRGERGGPTKEEEWEGSVKKGSPLLESNDTPR